LERKLEVDLQDIARRLQHDDFWCSYLSARTDIGFHLAIFAEPFLSTVLDGSKTIESRFSRVRCAPYDEVRGGDVILLKRAGGPVCGLVLAESAWFFDLAYEPLDRIRIRHGDMILADDGFWDQKRSAQYATLIQLRSPATLEPFTCHKRDRRGWVPLNPRQYELL
jgi:hypothetical protein